MKKLSILAVALVALSAISCKKDYTCVCSDDGGEVNKIIGVSKKTAKANCVSTVSSGYTRTCTLSK